MANIYEGMLSVHPQVIDDVLYNPGIGFNTFQRFNGDKLNEGLKWTEGFPIEYQEFTGSLENADHPYSTTSYFRIYWRFLEPERGKYNWELIDKALATSHERKQTMLLRVAPYGHGVKENPDIDVPAWYREAVGDEETIHEKWAVDGNNPFYVECFGGFIRALGERYDGHPDLESVDMSIVSAWGEGGCTNRLKPEFMKALVNAYADTFKNTPLLAMLTDPETNKYILSKTNAGYRFDCLGDLNEDSSWGYCHMLNRYPQQISVCGVQDAWKKGPVSHEVCWVMKHWHRMGWDIDYIIDQSLKWHISTFNSKSSAVPEEWKPNVERWLKKMGYRFALRHFACPPRTRPGHAMEFQAWWENQGVAPCYRDYPLAFRLKNSENSYIININTDIREWLPGDIFLDSSVHIPSDATLGKYMLQIAMLDKRSREPIIHFATAGREADGWYSLGEVEVQDKENPLTFPFDLYFEA